MIKRKKGNYKKHGFEKLAKLTCIVNAMRINVASDHGLPINWRPIGKPDLSYPTYQEKIMLRKKWLVIQVMTDKEMQKKER